MKVTKRFAILAITIGILWGGTTAYGANHPYLHGQLGANLLTDAELEGSPGEFDFDPGVTLGVAAGYELQNHLRIEGELDYRQNELNERQAPGSNQLLDGDISAVSLLVNAFYPFKNLPVPTAVTPYIGGGLGLSRIALNDAQLGGGRAAGTILADDEDTAFTYQLSLGFEYGLSSILDLTVDYRYLRTVDPKFDNALGGSLEAEFASHNFLIGITRHFRGS